MIHQRTFDRIFVPQGAEFAAVQRGVRSLPPDHPARPTIVAIPAGLAAVTQFLQQLPTESNDDRVLLLGLCGSISPDLSVGTAVAYRSVHPVYPVHPGDDRDSLASVPALAELPAVDALHVDTVVCAAAAKQAIAQGNNNVSVVDMESLAIVQRYPNAAIVRVVSDDLSGDIPDLSRAIDDRGNLQPIALTAAFLRQPIAALRLIRGSLVALDRLRSLTQTIVTSGGC